MPFRASPKALPVTAGSANLKRTARPASLRAADAALGVPWVSDSAWAWE
jgi:hypothetical protein